MTYGDDNVRIQILLALIVSLFYVTLEKLVVRAKMALLDKIELMQTNKIDYDSYKNQSYH